MLSKTAGRLAVAGGLALMCGAGCPGGDDGDESGDTVGDLEPSFPADYLGSYTEVRNCRSSGDHDLHNIRILADPVALGPYNARDMPFAEGAVVLKEEYDFGDMDCAGEILQWTVMRKLAPDASPGTLGWSWEQVDAQRNVVEVDLPRCISCHTGCGVEPDGFDGTCAVP